MKGLWIGALSFVGFFISVNPARSGEQRDDVSVNFDGMRVNEAPENFSTGLTGGGGDAVWTVLQDKTAPSGDQVLAQTSVDKTNYRFPLCVYSAFTTEDLSLSVKFKPVSGTVDQAAGLVWRYQDSGNYYVVRANALENNVVLYKVQNGKRSDLKPKGSGAFAYGKKAKVENGAWNTLAVTAKGNLFQVSLNGTHLFQAEDGTFPEGGKTGLWTKADSVTYFDDFKIKKLE